MYSIKPTCDIVYLQGPGGGIFIVMPGGGSEENFLKGVSRQKRQKSYVHKAFRLKFKGPKTAKLYTICNQHIF